MIGSAFCDMTGRVMELCEFVDDEQFSNLRSLVTQRGVKECVIPVKVDSPPAASYWPTAIEALQLSKVPLTTGKFIKAHLNSLDQDLKRLVGSVQEQYSLSEHQFSMNAVAVLIQHLELLQDDSNFGRFKLRNYDLSQYMKLDSSAVHALNLFPQPTDSNRNMNLFGLLNKNHSAAGTRLLSQWIQQPQLDLDEINRRHNLVELLVEDSFLRTALQETHLKGQPDIQKLARKFTKSSAGLEDLVGLYRFIIRLPGLIGSLDEYSGPHKELLDDTFTKRIRECAEGLSQLEAMVEQTVDLEAVERHEFLVNPAFDARLAELSAEKKEALREMGSIQRDTADDIGVEVSRVKLNNQSQLGYHLRITRKDEKLIRNNPRYNALETRKDGVRFTTMQLKVLSRKFSELSREYEEVQRAIVAKCMEVVVTYTPVMEDLSSVLAELDVIVAFAHVSMNAPVPFVRPNMLPQGSGILELKESRHPCMEMMDMMSFIPNDITMKEGESCVQVITGPNMGGKSTYIRQTGVIVLLAQIGCFVPCESATISVIDCILARVGAGDSQLKGVSTFMKEMLEASSILKAATPNSLLIIDELGRGTSTYDGFGLAWAIAEHIAKDLGCFTMFATHFHELTSLADVTPGVINKHVTAHTDDNSITMLYKIHEGPCDRSFGIHVSELAQFPKEVVLSAKRKAAELEDFGTKAAASDENEKDNKEEEGSSPLKKVKPTDAMETEMSTPSGYTKTVSFLREFSKLPLEASNSISDALRSFSERVTADADLKSTFA